MSPPTQNEKNATKRVRSRRIGKGPIQNCRAGRDLFDFTCEGHGKPIHLMFKLIFIKTKCPKKWRHKFQRGWTLPCMLGHSSAGCRCTWGNNMKNYTHTQITHISIYTCMDGNLYERRSPENAELVCFVEKFCNTLVQCFNGLLYRDIPNQAPYPLRQQLAAISQAVDQQRLAKGKGQPKALQKQPAE